MYEYLNHHSVPLSSPPSLPHRITATSQLCCRIYICCSSLQLKHIDRLRLFSWFCLYTDIFPIYLAIHVTSRLSVPYPFLRLICLLPLKYLQSSKVLSASRLICHNFQTKFVGDQVRCWSFKFSAMRLLELTPGDCWVLFPYFLAPDSLLFPRLIPSVKMLFVFLVFSGYLASLPVFSLQFG